MKGNSLKSDLDYVEFYANSLKKNNQFFKGQKRLIEAQLAASSSFFKNAFKGKDFKIEARKYLMEIGKI